MYDIFFNAIKLYEMSFVLKKKLYKLYYIISNYIHTHIITIFFYII